jgi:putative RNA 2'-phosphotransferase
VDPSFERELIIRTLAYALRHNPWQFGLDLDPEGWTSIDQLVESFRFLRYDWALLEWSHIELAIQDSGRYQVKAGRIRAAYGHSIPLGILPDIRVPPTALFHGTAENALPMIFREGLKPMGRRFVHLSSDRDYALRVANSKQGHAVLVVLADQAHAAGITFRRANEHVWLTEGIERAFLASDFA